MSFFFSTSKSKNEKVKQVERLLNAIPDVTRIDSTGSKFQCMLITPGAVQRSSIMITLLDQHIGKQEKRRRWDSETMRIALKK